MSIFISNRKKIIIIWAIVENKQGLHQSQGSRWGFLSLEERRPRMDLVTDSLCWRGWRYHLHKDIHWQGKRQQLQVAPYKKKKYILTMIKCLNTLPRLLLEYPPCGMPKTWIDGTLNNLVPSCNRRLHHAASRISFQSRIVFIIIFFLLLFIQGRRTTAKTSVGVS